MSSQLARFQKAMALRTALLQQGSGITGGTTSGGRKRKMKRPRRELRSFGSLRRGASVIGIRSGLPVRSRRATSMGVSYGGYGTKAGAMKNPWLAHVQAYRQEHPGMPYKKCLQNAAKTYRRGAGITGGRKSRMRR
jgi:hypothetical protein